jgi:germination protein M
MNTRIAASALVIMAVAVGGFTYIYLHRPTVSTPSVQPGQQGSSLPSSSSPGAPVAAPRQTYIYTVVANGGDENNLAPQPVTLPHTSAPARAALDALIDSAQSPLPHGTRLLDIRIDSGLATVNLSQEFKKNFQGGDLQEAQAVNSILMTLGQFSTVDRVQILVEGAQIDSLGGHFELGSPVDVIRTTGIQQAKNDQSGQ